MTSRHFKIAALVIFTASAVLADASRTSPSRDELSSAVRRLGAEDYATRAQATSWLWAAGPAAEDALKEGLKNPDAEVVARCRDLLDKIPYGITPDMPRRYVELIGIARAGGAGAWPGIAPELLDLGPRGLEIARKLIERVANNDGQREAMNHTLDLEGWRVAAAMIAAGRHEQAEQLLERSAVAVSATNNDLLAVRHYAASLALCGKLDTVIPRWQALVEKHGGKSGSAQGRLQDGTPDSRVSAIILVHLARLQGDLATARRAVDAAGRDELKEAVLFDQSAWSELANLASPENRIPALTTGLKAIYFDLAGKGTDSEAALAELRGMTVARASAAAPPLVFRAFMYARHPKDSLDALDKYKGLDGVLPQFEILCQQHRYDDAFQRLEKPVGERSSYRWHWDTAKLRVHHQRGEREQYAKIVAGLAKYNTLVQAELTAAQECVEQLVALRRTEDALPIAAALLNSGVSTSEVFGKLYPKSALGAETWWRYLRLQHPNEPLRGALVRLPALLDKRLATAEGRAMIAAFEKVARAQSDSDRWLEGLADSCNSAGMGEEARRYCGEAAERSNSTWAWVRLGDLRAEQAISLQDKGASQDAYLAAERAYGKAFRADKGNVLALWLCGWASDKANGGGTAMRELAHLLLLGDEDGRLRFAEELAKRSAYGPEIMEGVRQQRRFILRLNGPGSSFGRNSMSYLSGDVGAHADRVAAADAAQRFLIRMMRTNAYFKKNSAYLTVLHRLAFNQAHVLVAKGDIDGAMREAEIALTTLPGNGEPAGSLVPDLVKRGRTAEADKLYGMTVAVQDKLCGDFPQSADFCNSRAWLSARCRRDLDLGTTHARKAIELEPGHAGYHETLAEVLFQRGEQAAAKDEIKRCCDLDPKNVYYAKQRRRIEAGDRNAPLPEGR